MDLELTDKVALVTGGSKGIGEAIVRQLLSEGARVANANRSTTEGQALEDRAVTESPQPLKATVAVEAPVAAGQPAPSPASRAVPTASVEPAATEQGPTRGAAAALSALQILAIGLGLLLLVFIAATLLLRRRTR